MAVATTDPFTGYTVEGIYDEMLDGRSQPRKSYRRLHRELLKLTPEELWRSKQQADLSFFNAGIRRLTLSWLKPVPTIPTWARWSPR